MEYLDEKGAAKVINDYIEREMSEYKKVAEKEIAAGNIAPEAKAAFSRKPYYSNGGMNLKNRPVLR